LNPSDNDDVNVTMEETMGHVSFDVLPLLRKLVPGGDGSRLIERGVKHKWVKLVQTTTTTIGGGSVRRRESTKTRGGARAAALAASLGDGDFNFSDDEEEENGTDANEGGSVIKVHKNAGEICVSVVLVSECEILSDRSDRYSDGIQEAEEEDDQRQQNNFLHRNSPRSSSPRNASPIPNELRNASSSMVNTSPSSNRRVGVHRGFGDQDFHYAASKLRTVRKELGLKPMELFATIDTNRSGTIDRQQFVDVMINLDNDTSADEASLVFDHFDVNNNGFMNYNEFLKMMVAGEVLTKETMNQHRMSDEEHFLLEDKKLRKQYHDMGIDAVVDRLRMERRKRNLLPQTMFDLFDIDNNGSLSREELEDALVRMKMPHTGIEVEGMVYLFDLDRDGLLDYREFLNLVTGGTSALANEYRLYKKNHPLHEPPRYSDDDDEEDEHSSYIIAPSNISQNTTPLKSSTKKKMNRGRHRKGSISLLKNTVNKIAPKNRRLRVCIHGAYGKHTHE
jgi:Ca2+-binding EF-hand superfamily protein